MILNLDSDEIEVLLVALKALQNNPRNPVSYRIIEQTQEYLELMLNNNPPADCD